MFLCILRRHLPRIRCLDCICGDDAPVGEVGRGFEPHMRPFILFLVSTFVVEMARAQVSKRLQMTMTTGGRAEGLCFAGPDTRDKNSLFRLFR